MLVAYQFITVLKLRAFNLNHLGGGQLYRL